MPNDINKIRRMLVVITAFNECLFLIKVKSSRARVAKKATLINNSIKYIISPINVVLNYFLIKLLRNSSFIFAHSFEVHCRPLVADNVWGLAAVALIKCRI